jgi:hypothetical protein
MSVISENRDHDLQLTDFFPMRRHRSVFCQVITYRVADEMTPYHVTVELRMAVNRHNHF